MRTYPTDSPEAAARIVALTLVADGYVSQAELDVLEEAGAYSQLGIDRSRMLAVLQALCDDLLQAHHDQWERACRIDSRTLKTLMAEIQDPALREKVLSLCVAVALADDHVSEAESTVLVRALTQWEPDPAWLREGRPPARAPERSRACAN